MLKKSRCVEETASAPPKQESVQAAESEPQQEAQYAYHLGDTVYIDVYKRQEVQSPYGYVLDSTPVYFDVTEENSSEESLSLIHIS